MELSDYVPHRLALIYGICICLALWIATSNFNPVWIGLVQTPDKSIFSQYHSIKNCGFVPLNQTGSAFTFEIPIDHFNSTDNRNFQNRYWINDTYYQDGGPVFLFDTGEHGISDFMVSIFLEEAIGNSAIMALARKYNGLAILWEHRFYGMSLPFKLDEDTGMALDGYEAYRFLTTEQALEDTVYFANNFPPPIPCKESFAFSPTETPWVFVGGSYPGVRAALLRQRNPETWYASWASSAPVQAQVDMSVYYNPIHQVMAKNCSVDLHAATQYVDYTLQNGSSHEIAKLRQSLYMMALAGGIEQLDHLRPFPASPAVMTHWDISQVLVIPFQHTSNSFQLHGFTSALGPFCDYLEQYDPQSSRTLPQGPSHHDVSAWRTWLEEHPRKNETSDAGIAATYDSSTAFYALLTAIYGKMKDDQNGKPTLGGTEFKGDSISWMWQYCSEYGYFQGYNATNSLNFVSKFDNVSSTEDWVCRSTFPYAPSTPNVTAINQYGGWDMTPSNVMFSNGEFDPWRTLGVHANKNINPDARVRQSTKVVPKCNEPPPDDLVFGQCYEGQVHVSDLLSTMYTPILGQPSPFEMGFGLFSVALDDWFPCFKKSSEIESF